MNHSTPGFPVHHQLPSLLKPMSIESVMPSNHLILCRPLLLPPSIFPSIRVFSNESVLRMRWPKYWSFSFSISPSNEYSGLISFRMDCLDLLAVQGTLKSLLQHHSSKSSILRCSAFFIVQLSYPHMTTGKTIALTRRTFVGKIMSLLFNMLSRLVLTFLPRSKCLLISWLQSPSAAILEPNSFNILYHLFPNPLLPLSYLARWTVCRAKWEKKNHLFLWRNLRCNIVPWEGLCVCVCVCVCVQAHVRTHMLSCSFWFWFFATLGTVVDCMCPSPQVHMLKSSPPPPMWWY